MKKVLFIFGTRPEAIKMAPLIKEFQKNADAFLTTICITAQHRQMLDQVLTFFDIIPDYDLDLMQPNQTLSNLTACALKELEGVIKEAAPDLIFVQGDTTTAFVGALAAYYQKIPIAHLEAGLRSGNKLSPFPEEANRIMTGHLSEFHFAPTLLAKENLNREGISKHIYIVGNTVTDALFLGLDIIRNNKAIAYSNFFSAIDFSKKVILVTSHRRESFGEPFEQICLAIREIAETYADVEVVYPVHLNPHVQETANRLLKNQPNIHLIAPLDYPHLLWLMNKSYLVLTDSGGIQEEGPSLGKPVLVMRNVTERQEGVDAGTALLLGTDRKKIVGAVSYLLTDKEAYQKMACAINPYGDGTTSKQVVGILRSHYIQESVLS